MGDGGQFVFGYGSLVAGAPLRPARLRGHRRAWGVAMDNSVDIPGYKYYRRSEDGSRPQVFVAFLDIVEDAQATTGGSLIAVDETLLRVLDERERNYARVDVSGQVEGAPPGTIWTYRGSAAGRARLERGMRRKTAVVDADYVEGVRVVLHALGHDDDLDPSPLAPIRLDRVDIPPENAAMLRECIRTNAKGEQVDVIEAAAASRPARCSLSSGLPPSPTGSTPPSRRRP